MRAIERTAPEHTAPLRREGEAPVPPWSAEE